jgi:hypothetical protein
MAVCERAGTPMHECSAAAYGAVWGLYMPTGEPAEKRLPLFKRFNELFARSDAPNDAVMCAIDQWDAEQTRIHQQGLAEDDPLSRLWRPLMSGSMMSKATSLTPTTFILGSAWTSTPTPRRSRKLPMPSSTRASRAC